MMNKHSKKIWQNDQIVLPVTSADKMQPIGSIMDPMLPLNKKNSHQQNALEFGFN